MAAFCYRFISGYGSAKIKAKIGSDLPKLLTEVNCHVFVPQCSFTFTAQRYENLVHVCLHVCHTRVKVKVWTLGIAPPPLT